MAKTNYQSVDEYIATFPETTQTLLQQIRAAIQEVMPEEAEEVISYQIPAYKIDGKRAIVYFSGYAKHVGVYPVPASDPALTEELKPLIHGKGTLRFPLDKPIPLDLIKRVTLALLKDREA